MIDKCLVERFHRAFTAQRWNDHIRPMELTVQGKHAHMMTIAWVLGRYQEDQGSRLDWIYLIEGGMFELLRRCVTFDLKSQVFDYLVRDDARAAKLNKIVLKELNKEVGCVGGGFSERMTAYFRKVDDGDRPPSQELAYRILRAASSLATAWEFRVIEQSNAFLAETDDIRMNLVQDRRWHQYLPGFTDIERGETDLARFIDLCGRLRFQTRWSHTPIIPSCNVLEHELLVANLAYLLALEKGRLSRARYNDYFGGLFHDFLEVLTRDIVAPFKRKLASAGLDRDIDAYAENELREQVGRMLPEAWFDEIKFLCTREFEDRQWQGPQRLPADGSAEEAPAEDKLDGALVKSADNFAAFTEAYFSIDYGVTSRDLRNAIENIYKDRTKFGDDFDGIYREWYGEIEPKLRKEEPSPCESDEAAGQVAVHDDLQ
jgi:putative hydrolase of HD superfamily